jgi:hypothetical protein
MQVVSEVDENSKQWQIGVVNTRTTIPFISATNSGHQKLKQVH